MTQLGYDALVIALFAASYAVLVDMLGSWKHNLALLRSARNATITSFVCLSIAGIILMTLLIKGDFSVIYVAEHTARDLPLAYKISAFWAGAAGSLLLWLWMQAGFIVLVFAKSLNHEKFSSAARTIGNFVSIFFLLVLILDKNPFAVSLITPQDGAGLNPLLQHPAMALHPPALFLGYAAFVVPFSWSFATLKNSSDRNLSSLFVQTQRWILWAWMFLTIGIVLGAWWAYEELGWGGYWAWDPVENSSLMPWLTATALLHCSRTHKRNTSIATWLIALSIITFSLCIFGTFLTRYGLISSVHAFPEPGLGILFMVLLAHIWVIALVLFIRALITKRISISPSGHIGHRIIVWNNWLLLILTLVILVGTLFPFLSGLVSRQNINLKPEYFTKITAPGGLALLLLLAVCPNLFRHGFGKNIRTITVIGFAITAVVTWWITKALAMPCLILCAFAGLNLFADFFSRYRITRKIEKPGSDNRINLRWIGTRIVHLAVVLAFMGIAGSGGYGTEKQVALRPGESTQMSGLTFTYHDLKAEHGPNFTAVTADISIHKSDTQAFAVSSQNNSVQKLPQKPDQPDLTTEKSLARLHPAMAVYARSGKRTSEVDIKRTLVGDIYLALTQVSSSDKLINLSILIKPLINWIWIGGTMMVIGVLIIQISFLRNKNKNIFTESKD